MPHFDEEGREEWVCQKGGHICTGTSIWVEAGSEDAERLGIREGNVCRDCFGGVSESERLKFKVNGHYRIVKGRRIFVREHPRIINE